jgi:molybdopterin synthase catalytic subunit
MRRISVTPSPFDADAELAAFAQARADAGALASFVGYCRSDNGGSPVEQLELEHYSGFTEHEIEALAEAVSTRRNLMGLLVIHRIGIIAPSEPIVLVAAFARHRSEAFTAVEELMDYLKTDAPFWKREASGEGVRWIEPTQDDKRRRSRWSSE